MFLKKSLFCLSILAISASVKGVYAETFNFAKQAKNAETLVVFQAGEKISSDLSMLDKQTNKQLSKAMSVAGFKGENKQIVDILAPVGVNANRVLIVGLGEVSTLSAGEINNIGASITAKLAKSSNQQVSVLTQNISDKVSNAHFAAQIAHGINLRAYQFDKYFTQKKPAQKHYSFSVSEPKKAASRYKDLSAVEQGVFLARDLTSEVPTEMNPVHFAKAAQGLESLGVKVTVLTPKEIKALGMGALHAVGRGSLEGARLVVAHWQGNNDKPIALVGKGITFDSGGYNIKASGDSISRMKSDMAGAAAVLGTVKAMALQKADVNVVAVMALAANMVSKTSVAPGDVVNTAAGLSVEIVNTDAEGRLVLADGMWYAREYYKPKVMIDVATLTGSKVRAVGNRFVGLFGENDQLNRSLIASGNEVEEKLWHLPLGYEDLLKSPIADLKNSGYGGPGATTAAMFLKQFSGDTTWAHLDIAGNALARKDKDITPAGGTGHGVRLLSHWLMNK